MSVVACKKLIEVALPLEAINKASAREKSIRHGHPSTLHLWWARRPLAAARAVLFAQLVDDPSAHPDLFPTAEDQERERQRLFRLIEELVQWENTTNETLLAQARAEIRASWRRTCAANAHHPRAAELFNPEKLPAFHDPFAGGGSLPLEAQRLGLEAYASDINPVAVLICKAMIEIPPRFADRAPVNPEARRDRNLFGREWRGAQGLAEDVRYYGRWLRDEAERRIGHLYPKIRITPELVRERPDLQKYLGRELTVIAWLWARTVRSPNPAFAQVEVPLVSTFLLAGKPGKEAYVEPVIDGDSYRFTVRVGKPKNLEEVKRGTKLARGANFRCLLSGMPITGSYIKAEGRAGRMGAKMMAIVAEGEKERVYLSPTEEMEVVAKQASPSWTPDIPIAPDPRALWTISYGLTRFGDLFTPRQLVALTTFSDLVQEARERVYQDALAAGLPDDGQGLAEGGTGARAYAEAVSVYLAFAVDKAAVYWNTLCPWLNQPKNEIVGNSFGRQALPMIWDFAESNPFSAAGGTIEKQIDYIEKSILFSFNLKNYSYAYGYNALDKLSIYLPVISTDPPYYDNIGYADLSDFFYIWLRRSLKKVFPSLFQTLTVPKDNELVATSYRHGSKEKAEKFFLAGMTRVMINIHKNTHPAFPITIYYAFKQAEREIENGSVSTGWDTFLESIISAGFHITGTWPIRTEFIGRMVGHGTNALASSIVLVCRPRPEDAPVATRREFLSVLKRELPAALQHLQRGNIAPVDLAQAAIGPGMAVFSRYRQVLDATGKPLSVREALALINQTLDEVLAAQEGDFDPDSRWAVAWFEQFGFAEGEFGVAETLSKAKNTSVDGLVEAGILVARAGRVRLLRPRELEAAWDPAEDPRLTVWEMTHQLIRTLEKDGETAAAQLAARLGSRAELARELAYRLYTICDRRRWTQEALSYNALVQSWPEISRLARERRAEQTGLPL